MNLRATPYNKSITGQIITGSPYVVAKLKCRVVETSIAFDAERNRLANRPLYKWTLVAREAGAVTCSNGMALWASYGIADAPAADLTILVASLDVNEYRDPLILRHLRALRSSGMRLGAISTGTLILARAGILSGIRVTIHWESRRVLEEEFPDLDVSPELYCMDRGLLTAAGGTAAMDLMLAVILERNGRMLASNVARQFLHGPIRRPDEGQSADIPWRYRITDSRLIDAIRIMEATTENPVRIARIAGLTGVSERQLERLFTGHLGKTPSNFYMELRTDLARDLLLHSPTSLYEISELTGFSSVSHFSRAMSKRFGMPPTAIRQGRITP